MISGNVMSFMKKIVKSGGNEEESNTGAIYKIGQTLATGLQEMALGRSEKKPTLSHLTEEERSILKRVFEKEEEFEKETQRNWKTPTKELESSPVIPVVLLTCRSCRKSLEPSEQSYTCDECGQPVCEDCASYSSGDTGSQSQGWKCSFCRRRQHQDRLGIELPPGSGMHRVPSVRRMAEKLAHGLKDGDTVHFSDSEILLQTLERRNICSITGDLKGYGLGSSLTDIKGRANLTTTTTYTFSEQTDIAIRRNSTRISLEKAIKQQTPQSPVETVSSRDLCLSSGTTSDRRSSSESQKGSGCVKPPPIPPRSRQNSGGSRQNSKNSSGSHHQSQKHSSESSVEEHSHDSDYERRKKSRLKRRSKIQRQKNYIEEPDSDQSGIYHDDWTTRGGTFNSSLDSSSALESFDNDLDFVPKRKLDLVPGHPEKEIRHIASESALYIRRHSSESSDISDVSGDYSTHSERSGFDLRRSNEMLLGSSNKNLYNRHRKNGDGETTLSPPNTLDSTPSPEEKDINRFSTDKSLSLEDTELCHPNFRREIPYVTVDACNRRKPSFEYIYPPIDLTRRSSTGRALPRIPDNQSSLFPVLTGRTRSTHSLDIPREELGLTERRASAPEGETIKIVIDDVDSERKNQKAKTTYTKRLLLQRDPLDAGARTKGFGMRLMGGKKDEDGELYAQISWTVAGGPADNAGLKQGDRVLEWNGLSLTGLTYEDVCSVMDRTGDTVEILVDSEMGPEIPIRINGYRKKSAPCALDTSIEPEPSHPGRRRLPKTPDLLCQDNLQGEIGIQIWFDQGRGDILVTLIGARGLRRRRSSTGALPRAYAKIRLIPHTSHGSMKTQISDPCVNPEWNKTFIFTGITSNNVLEKMLDISVWDNSSVGSNTFLGEAQIPLRRADLQDCPEWYPLSYHHQSQQPLLSPPHKSVPSLVPSTPAHDYARRLLRRVTPGDSSHSHSLSELSKVGTTSRKIIFTLWPDDEDKNDELDEEEDDEKGLVRSSSMDSSLLHPNSAVKRSGSPADPERKTSAPNVTYVPPPHPPRSTPSSRRGSQLVSQDSLPELYSSEPKARERLRSASLRVHRPASSDSEKPAHENLDQRRLSQLVKQKLSRTLSLKSEKDKRSVGLAQNQTSEKWHSNYDSPELSPESESASLDDLDISETHGPGQLVRKKLKDWSRLGEIKLGLLLTKGQLEVDIVGARTLKMNLGGQLPDTYVKTYLKDGERKLQKRKTRVVRHSTEPQYRQTLKYNGSDVLGRILLVMVWERQKGFEHNQAIGATEVQLDHLDLTKLTVGWYRLYPLSQMDLESNEST